MAISRIIDPHSVLSDRSATSLTNFMDLLSHMTGSPPNDLLLFMSNTTIDFLSEIEPSYEFRPGFGYQNHMHAFSGLVGSDLYLNRTSRGPGATFEGVLHYDGEGAVRTSRYGAYNRREKKGMKTTGWYALYSVWLEWAAPAGSVAANAEDLEKYLGFVFKQRINGKGERVLSENAFRNAFAPHNPYIVDYSIKCFQ
ncbi:hypothetical protein BJ742DRAFT_770305 [Cladochytrium replicatum]|nr:hypothetical protein BJ742DRAFT_770305 [Cladochytrium replicatum]